MQHLLCNWGFIGVFVWIGLALQTACAQEKDPMDLTVRSAEHLEPTIPRPEQEAEAKRKLAALKEKHGRRPNVLILLVDDMGWGDPGCYGGGAAIGAPTPNIDALAASGLRLTSCYSQPTCTPTRAAIQTGRIPFRSGLTRPLLSGENPTVSPWAEERTAASLLSSNGYRTALAGKWHLGEMEGTQPHQVGFDEYYGILSVVSEFSQFLDDRLYPDLVLKKDRLAKASASTNMAITQGRKGEATRNAKELKSLSDLANLDQDFADFSEDFIRRAVDDEKPFYLIHNFSRLHNDNYLNSNYQAKSPAALPYRDGTIEVDDIVGRLLNVLRETGQLENTLVFLTSDNGANEDTWPDSGHHPWRGGKGTTWEGGVRVAGIASWPGMIEEGRVSDGLFDLCDLFNTSLGVAGIHDSIPTERYIDGIDQTSFLLSDEGESMRQTVFMYSETTLCALRWMEYKIHFKIFQTAQPRQNLDESTLVGVGMSPWVYNLYADPKEQRSSGHRYFEWGLPRVIGIVKNHAETVTKYPPKDIGLGVPGR
ncbi:MAG: arylsulfatase [Planctomycetota bacterium]